MKIRNLIQVGLLGTAMAFMAGAQPARSERPDVEKDIRHRDQLARQVEADKRSVDHEREEWRRSSWYAAGRESRELRNAENRLNHDTAELRALDERIALEMNRLR
jgi:hypothetical protein